MRALRGYLLALGVLYTAAVVAAGSDAALHGAARGETIAVLLCVVGIVMTVGRPAHAATNIASLACAVAAIVAVELFHTAAVAQVWALVPAMFIAMFVRCFYPLWLGRAGCLAIGVVVTAALVAAPAPVPGLWYATFPICIIAAAEAFGGLHAALLRMALTDPLTHVWNRAGAEVAFTRMAHRARGLTTCTTLIVDIDNFKAVNDTHGHPAGDRILVTLADRLRDAMPTESIVARLGGDEFVVAATESADAVRARVAPALAGLPTSVSVGIFVGPLREISLAEAIAGADRDMYRRRAAARAADAGESPAEAPGLDTTGPDRGS